MKNNCNLDIPKLRLFKVVMLKIENSSRSQNWRLKGEPEELREEAAAHQTSPSL